MTYNSFVQLGFRENIFLFRYEYSNYQENILQIKIFELSIEKYCQH